MAPQPLLARRANEAPAVIAALPHSDGVLLALLAGLAPPAASAGTAGATPTQEAQVKENFGQLPLSFEENVGQTDDSVQFFTRGPGYATYLTATEAVMVLDQGSGVRGQGSEGREALPAPSASEGAKPPAVIRLQILGSNPAPAVTGTDPLPGRVNYFLGNDPAQWHTNVATFGRVAYDEVYPGIDLVWYGNGRQLEYDFVVSPGADPGVIRLNVSGAERMEIDAAGDLLMHTNVAGSASDRTTLRQHRPFVYQDVHGTRQEVASRFVLEGGQVRFDMAAYDAGRPLVIDPVLSYSTYLGGGNTDLGVGLGMDPATGDVLLTGWTSSTNFPTANPFQPTNRGSSDVFVTRLNAAGSALVWSTYLGGSSSDNGYALGVDPATGDALLTGITRSTDFPTANPFQPNYGGGLRDAFVTRLRADGAALVWSTYLGGNEDDFGRFLTSDSATGDVLLTGYTRSTNFPTVSAWQPALRGPQDAFVTRLRADGAALVWSTYLGGSGDEAGWGVAVDPTTGEVLLTGATSSTNFPTANPFQRNHGGGILDAFVTRLRADGAALAWSTYLGGGGDDEGYGPAVDPATGDVLLTGYTRSINFPTANPLQPSCAGGTCRDAFVTRLRADGVALVWSTYLGGSFSETGIALALDPITGDALLTGSTSSTNFPTANPVQPANRGLNDAFVTRLHADGTTLVWSTYLGGTSEDNGFALAVDPTTGDALITGQTQSTNFPTANPLQPACGGCPDFSDAFVTRIGSSPVASYYVYPDSGKVPAGVPFDLSVFAFDENGYLIPDYIGEIAFWSTDPNAVTPGTYTFERTDRGVATFPKGVTLVTPGTQELYVFDTKTYKVVGVAVFEVV